MTVQAVSRMLATEFPRSKKVKGRIKGYYEQNEGFTITKLGTDSARIDWHTGVARSYRRQWEKLSAIHTFLTDAGYEVTAPKEGEPYRGIVVKLGS